MNNPSLWTVDWVIRATGGTLLAAPAGYGELSFRKISTDSRTIGSEELFVPLKGPNFDGHDYIAATIEKGAKGILVREGFVPDSGLTKKIVFIAVKDTLHALGDLAAAHRRAYSAPLVAVTGSTGKTTTKEMLGEILKVHFHGDALVTEGNLNNLIGVPQTLFGLNEHHKAVVLEMGMSMRGEIARLAQIAAPDIGVITNVSEVHMEHLASIGAIASAKGELLEQFGADKTAVLNADDARVSAMGVGRAFLVKTFSVEKPADATAHEIRMSRNDGIEFTLSLGERARGVLMTCVGRHNVSNALAAALAADQLGVPIETIAAGLENFRPAAMRLRILNLLRVKILDDTYNANPRSMDAALATLKELAGKNRQIVVVGDMKELGKETEAAHRRLGRHVAKNGVSFLIALGEFAPLIVEGAKEEMMPADRIVHAHSHEEIVELLRAMLEKGDVVLVKGSRAMRMECVIHGLKGELF